MRHIQPKTIMIAACLLALVTARPSQAQTGADSSAFEGDVYDDEEWVEPEGDPENWAEPEAEVDVNYFFQQLAPYGEWIWTPEHGWVWRPNEVGADWQPYTQGRWVYTDYGWTWSSSFRWGWAPFHYGRWAWLDHVGWVWVPGTVWGPAWVVWRYSDAYVGWSPLMAGYDWWYGWSYYPVFYDHWTFIHWNHFCSHHPRHHYLPRHRVKSAFRHSYYPRRCRDAAGPACRRGPSRKAVQRVAHIQVPKTRIQNMARAKPIRNLQAKPKKLPKLGLADDTLRIYRPRTEITAKRPGMATRPGVAHRPSKDLGVVQRPSRTRPASLDPSARPAAAGPDGPISTIRPTDRQPSQGATILPRRPPRSGVGSGWKSSAKPRPYTPKRGPAVSPKTQTKTPSMRPTRTRPSRTLKPTPRPSRRPTRTINRPSSSSKSRSTYRPSSSRSSSKSRGSSSSKRSYSPSSSRKSSSSGSSHRSSSRGSSRSRRR